MCEIFKKAGIMSGLRTQSRNREVWYLKNPSLVQVLKIQVSFGLKIEIDIKIQLKVVIATARQTKSEVDKARIIAFFQ